MLIYIRSNIHKISSVKCFIRARIGIQRTGLYPNLKATIVLYNVRCLVATVALGMGLDITDVDLIVHVGWPKSVLSYWQEADRCARDGRNGFSLILYDHFTISENNGKRYG